jgi:hypothetical protein
VKSKDVAPAIAPESDHALLLCRRSGPSALRRIEIAPYSIQAKAHTLKSPSIFNVDYRAQIARPSRRMYVFEGGPDSGADVTLGSVDEKASAGGLAGFKLPVTLR